MVRSLVAVVGALAALFPDRLVDVFEAVAVDNPGENAIGARIGSIVRAEGLLVTLAALVGGRPYAWTVNATGVFGAVVLAVPRLYRSVVTRLLYADPDHLEWNERFGDALRVIGVLYVLMALRALRRRRATH